MSYYTIALFLHVVGSLGVFALLGIEWMNLQQLRFLTTAEEVGQWLHNGTGPRALGGISMLLILIPGFYMTATAWGGAGWISVALGALIVVGALGGAITSRRMAAIKRSLNTESGAISSSLYSLLYHPLLSVSLHVRIAISLGIIFLMTVKPDLVGSLIVMGVALILGVATALPVMSRRQTPKLAA